MIVAAWKNDHTLRPTSANSAYGTPAVSTSATLWNPITKATSSASG